MKKLLFACSVILAALGSVYLRRAEDPKPKAPAPPLAWAKDLPVYDHVVIVMEENKDYKQIIGSPAAPYINSLRKDGANLTHMFGEEHYSQGNYFWLF